MYLTQITMETTFVKLRVVIHVSVLCVLVVLGNTCGPSEYKSSKGECCPMCNIGSVVYRDCVGDSSTTCIPCSKGTFMNEPNGLYKCFTCNNCSESRGLYTHTQCTTITDTVCDVLNGYYCIEFSESQCIHAQKHSVCKPGQQIKTPGTKRSDTVCEDCSSGFYSPAGVNCTRWTDCKARNEIETEAGSSIKDVTCTENKRNRWFLILPAAVTAIVCFILYCTGNEPKRPIEETNPEIHSSKKFQTPGENEESEIVVCSSSAADLAGISADHKQHRATFLPT